MFSDRIEMSAQQLIDAVRSAEFFDLVEITEPEPNALRLVLAEMSVDDKAGGESSPVPRALPVRRGSRDRIFEVSWERYAAYTVLNESYDSGNGEDVFEGNLFRIYSKSRYLQFVEEEIENVVFLAPGYKHWGVVCVNHIVHVIAAAEPRIFHR